MKPINLDEKRKDKGPHCEWCGEPQHKLPNGLAFPLMCPRVTSVTYSADEVRVYFNQPPMLIALRDLPDFADAQDE